MRKFISALVISLDGLIEGPNGQLDWIDTWKDPFDRLPHDEPSRASDSAGVKPRSGSHLRSRIEDR